MVRFCVLQSHFFVRSCACVLVCLCALVFVSLWACVLSRFLQSLCSCFFEIDLECSSCFLHLLLNLLLRCLQSFSADKVVAGLVSPVVGLGHS